MSQDNHEKKLPVIAKAQNVTTEKIPALLEASKKQIQEKAPVIMKANSKKKLIVGVAAGLIGISTIWSYFVQPGSFISNAYEAASSIKVDLEDIEHHTDFDALSQNVREQISLMVAQKIAGGGTKEQLGELMASPQVQQASTRGAQKISNPEAIYNMLTGHQYEWRAYSPNTEPRNQLIEQGHSGIGEYQVTLKDVRSRLYVTAVMNYQWGTWRITNIILPPAFAHMF